MITRPEKPQIGYLLKRINETLERQVNQDLKAYDVTFAQMRMLINVYFAGKEGVQLKELEHFFHVAQSTAAGIAVRLEKKGLVYSSSEPDDRRVKVLYITDKGKKLVEDDYKNYLLTEEKIVSVLSEDEKEQFRDILSRVLANLTGE